MRQTSTFLAIGMFFSLFACGGGGGGTPTYSISGTITLNGTGYSGVAVNLSGDTSGSAITDANGEYSFTDLEDGSYTVTPSLANQTLTPTNIASIPVSAADSTGNDFALVTHSVSGQVTFNSSGYASATVSLSGSATASTTTPASGHYTFDGLLNGTYTVTPTVSGQSLTPTDIASIPVSAADSTGNDFALVTHSVSGQVTLNSSGYAGATVSLTGSATASTTTPASGHYTFDGLLNGTYTVTPDVSSQSLAPTDIAAIPISGSDSASNDFALVAYSLSGRVTYDGFGESDVTVSLSGAAAAVTTTDGTGDYSFTGLLNGSYTVTPSLYSQNFFPVSDTIVVSSTSETGVDFTIPYLIWFIDKNSPTSTPDGMSWATAYTDPQTGADLASAGEQVWIAEGRYASMDTSDPTMPVLAMKDGVEFYGGFAGTETTISERDLSAHTTTLDGENLTLHVVVGADGATLDGFTVTRGNANDDSVGYGIYGGGMFNLNVSPTVTNCTFTGNSVDSSGSSGGGMFNISSSPTITNCTFTDNSAGGLGAKGGGMFNTTSSPVITNCMFTGNSAADGGGMYNANSYPTITNGTFTANSAVNFGGGMYNNGSSPTITNSILWGNDAPGSPEIYGPTTVAYSNIEGGYFGINNINVDPLFYDPTFGGYRLGEMSPCLDVGNNSAVTTSYDLAGIDRIQNTTVDLGAYEGGFAYVPKTLYVDFSSTAIEPNGLTWGTAFQGLQETLAVAVSGDEIWVAEGTYYPTVSTDRSISFQLVVPEKSAFSATVGVN